jgi:hypothetical protein
VLTLINRDSFSAIKNILRDFAKISGLECNYDKTALLPINQLTNEEEAIINECGFKIVDKFKLLGATVTANAEDLVNNFDPVIAKIDSLIAFWSRFRLSLPGRIAVAKTFLISQINYLGSIIMPSDVQLCRMQTAINNFIKKNLRISDERVYLPVEKGGLGFFNIKTFLQALMATWILKAKKHPIDNWRFDVNSLAPDNNPLLIRSCDVPVPVYPLLHGIVSSYEQFYSNFSATDNNFRDSQIFNNNIFKDPETGTCITIQFFGAQQYGDSLIPIRKLTYNDCFDGNNFKDLDSFRESGLFLTHATWMRIRNIILRVKNTVVPSSKKSQTIDAFTSNWKKGSKKLRLHFTGNSNPLLSNSFIKFKELVYADPGPQLGEYWFSSWNTHSFANDFRQFIFNFRYNYLPTNNRLNAFLAEVDPRCTYCLIQDSSTQQRDSFSHCFFLL